MTQPCTIDVTTIPFDVVAGANGSPIGLGGLTDVGAATDPFLMEYADGLPVWCELTAADISRTYGFYTLILDLSYRTPYLDQVQSSNVASHIVRSLVQTATGNQTPGALGNPSTKVMLLVASDINVTGLAGLFHLDWTLPSYPPDFCAPSGTLAFQLRHSQSTGLWGEATGSPLSLGHGALGGLGIGVAPCAAGLAISTDGRTLVAANLGNDSITVFNGGLGFTYWSTGTELDLRPGKSNAAQSGVPGGEYPFWVVVKGTGLSAQRVFPACAIVKST